MHDYDVIKKKSYAAVVWVCQQSLSLILEHIIYSVICLFHFKFIW